MSSAPTSTFTVLSEEQFDARFPLLTNHLDRNASFGGCMFETYGAELQFVRRQNMDCIWTYADDDNGRLCLSSGYHLVNRIGYVISTVPIEAGHDYFVPLEVPEHEQAPPATGEVQPVRTATIDPRFTDIAKRILGIPTLETRGSDSLDFHNVGVWQVAKALQAAYRIGADSGVNAEVLAILRRFVETADDYLPDGIDDPAYSPEAELLSDARAVLAKSEGGAP